MRAVRALFCSAALLALFAPGVRADDYNKLTYFTFSAPVQVPGVTLPAGKYTFKLADPESGRRAIQIWDSDGKLLTTLLTVSDQRMDAKEPMVMFNERPAGEAPAVRSWYYEGEHAGYEFVYPKDQAMKIARASHQPVLSTDETASDLGALKAAKVSRVDETGTLADADTTTAPSSSSQAQAATTTAPSTSSTSTASATTTASSTSTDSANAAPRPAATASSSTTATDSASATTTAPEPSANRTEPTAAVARTDATVTSPAPVGTSGSVQANSAQPAATAPATSSAPRQAAPAPADTVAQNRDAALPGTSSSLPLLALLSGLCLAIGLSVRRLRGRVV